MAAGASSLIHIKKYLNKEDPIFHDSISPHWLNFKKDLNKRNNTSLYVCLQSSRKLSSEHIGYTTNSLQ